MKNLNKIIGIAGAVLLLFSLVYYSITNIWDVVNWITFIFGVLGIGYFIFDYYKNREKELSKRSLQYGSNVAIQVVIVVGIVALLAFITTKQHLRSDWTENKLYSLADQTDKILNGLDKDILLTAFVTESDESNLKDMFDEYKFKTGNLNYKFVDPFKKPQIASKYKLAQDDYGVVIVECESKKEKVKHPTESNLTNVILKVSRDIDKTIYFLTGHGEKSINDEKPDGFKKASNGIKSENYVVNELNLSRRIGQGKGIPDSCSVLILANPKTSFFPAEFDTIRAYLEKGGKLFALLNPGIPVDIQEFFKNYGVEVGNNVVLDVSLVSQLSGGGAASPLIQRYPEDNPITKEFSINTIYPLVCSVLPLDDKKDYEIKEFIKTSPNSYAETNLENNESTFNEGEDIKGPISIGLLIEKSIGDKKMSIAIIGDADFASNGYWQYGNPDMFLNTINYLAEEEDLISIRPKEIDDRRVTLTQADVSTIFYLVVIAIPLLVIIAGVVFYIKRGK